MTAVLLSAGPVSSHLTTRNMSSSFKVAVNKARFLSAANQLQSAGLGMLVVLENISRNAHVFVKKPPVEMAPILQMPENADMLSVDEYQQRYCLPVPSYITEKMIESVVCQGLVPPDHFRQRPQRKPSVANLIAMQNQPDVANLIAMQNQPDYGS